MRKRGNLTKELILERAAGLFNSLGYYRASISDLMQATGLEKGGIYNHFGSKDELAVAAFDYAVGLFASRLMSCVAAAEGSAAKLDAFVDAFFGLVDNPPLPGGCPLLNCAVENDDANPILAERVREAMQKLLSLAESLFRQAQNEGLISSGIPASDLATFLISSLEGGVMLSSLYEDKSRMEKVCLALKAYLADLKD